MTSSTESESLIVAGDGLPGMEGHLDNGKEGGGDLDHYVCGAGVEQTSINLSCTLEANCMDLAELTEAIVNTSRCVDSDINTLLH